MTDAVTVVDAHVHVHPQTDVGALLSAATRNLLSVATQLGAPRWHGVLMLAEMRGVDWFGATRRSAERVSGWSIEPAADDPATLIARGHEMTLAIMAGRQVVTAEGIEVLVLLTAARIGDGLTLAATLAAAASREALVVLPWGAGKWLGSRGRLVSEALEANPNTVFAGDNGGRPSLWPEPAVLRIARARGRPILSGTDPLPLPGEELRVGSFGFWLRGVPGSIPSSRSLRERLLNATPEEVRGFGHLLGGLRFVKNQIGLRLRKVA